MTYEVELLPTALRELDALPRQPKERLWGRIVALGENPRPPGAEPLRGNLRGFLRIREGDWRVIYRVDSGARMVTVVEVGDRRRVYDSVKRRR